MKCEVGIHTGSITLIVHEHVWRNLMMAMPAKIGFRRWTAIEVGDRIRFSRTQFTGTTPSSVTSNHIGSHHLRMHIKANTIVRCKQIEREIEVCTPARFELQMPPHHEWPWIKDTGHVKVPIETQRMQLVNEINARIRSCVKHHVDFPTNVPLWASRMLTEFEWQKVHANEEI